MNLTAEDRVKLDWIALKKKKAIIKIVAESGIYDIMQAQEMMALCTEQKYKRDARVCIKMAQNGLSVDKIHAVIKAVNK
jgi:hypothetical protein